MKVADERRERVAVVSSNSPEPSERPRNMAIRSDLLPTSLINIDLAKIFLADFVADYEFGRHGFDYQRKKYKRVSGKRQLIGVVTERCSGDPWWWPTENGESEEQWALASDNRAGDHATLTELLTSLRGGITTFDTGTRKAGTWKGFPGSLAAHAGCCIVLSTRPSIGGFPSPNTMKLYDVLAAVWPGGEFLRHVHVTDLSKFRGPTRDSDFEGMTEQMWQKSIRCLRQEFELLTPKATLIMPGVERFLIGGLSDLISTVASASATNAAEKTEITRDVAFLRLLRARRKHCMEQAPYWAPVNPKGGDEQREIGHSWCDILMKLGFLCF
jgi:hypothetical protein